MPPHLTNPPLSMNPPLMTPPIPTKLVLVSPRVEAGASNSIAHVGEEELLFLPPEHFFLDKHEAEPGYRGNNMAEECCFLNKVYLRRDSLEIREQEFYEALYTQSRVQFDAVICNVSVEEQNDDVSFAIVGQRLNQSEKDDKRKISISLSQAEINKGFLARGRRPPRGQRSERMLFNGKSIRLLC
ncbi:ATP-dependent helicase rhp16 isoform X3 [Canna indica]|uniref:ATP-dependent helicase rhp16 isoform X3 n=1 Tax=Canna indica TaxID=4628 RepID=A0AAQ3KFZ5_9LILI|nr:ATP-dependent helicase rhp16 isoform X3 [Canna indica]